jgi:hypothetical protein
MVSTANEARHEMQQVPAVLRQQSITAQNQGEGAIGHLIYEVARTNDVQSVTLLLTFDNAESNAGGTFRIVKPSARDTLFLFETTPHTVTSEVCAEILTALQDAFLRYFLIQQ